MTLTWNDKSFDWVNVGWFAALHAGALLAPWTFTWTGLSLALSLWWLSGSIGICLTYHRLLTHRGFSIPKPLEYLGTVAGMLRIRKGGIPVSCTPVEQHSSKSRGKVRCLWDDTHAGYPV